MYIHSIRRFQIYNMRSSYGLKQFHDYMKWICFILNKHVYFMDQSFIYGTGFTLCYLLSYQTISLKYDDRVEKNIVLIYRTIYARDRLQC